MTERSRWAADAVAHVTGVSRGDALDRRLRVTLNFHPDRETGGRSVIQRLVDEHVYRSQFETGTSNGGLTAHPGGSRWRWEQRIFGGAYDDALPGERPKYGALNHRERRVGGAPRFGSCHLRLGEPVLERTTFCFPDSALEPTQFATADRFDLTTDVEALVLDPCYRATSVEAHAAALPIALEWHEGRRLPVDELRRHPDFRGPRIVEVGAEVAEQGWLDARILGVAVAAASHAPRT
ncbi:MAG: DUF3626 domain-containing protein [Terracoccus sp.]